MTVTIDSPFRITPLEPVELDPNALGHPASNVDSIPPLAPHWQTLDFREILSRPAAFLSVSQSNSLYRPGGVQYAEGHAFRGSLAATVRAVQAARNAPNFASFNWIGFSVFRDDYPQTDFDRAQYQSWTGTSTPPRSRSLGTTNLSGNCASWCDRETMSSMRRRCRRRSLAPICPAR